MSLMTANPIIDLASEQQPSIYYLDDGTAIFKVVSDPNGLIIANAGSLALQNNGDAWIKSGNNDSVWTLIGGGGGASPGAPDHSVQYNDGGVFAGNTNFLYDPLGTPQLLLTAAGVGNEFAIIESAFSSFQNPALLQLVQDNYSVYYGLVFTNIASARSWDITPNDTGSLTITDSTTGSFFEFDDLGIFRNFVNNVASTRGFAIRKFGQTTETFWRYISSGLFSFGIYNYAGPVLTDVITYSLGRVGVNTLSPLASFHVNAANNTSVAGLFIANAPTVDVLQVSIDNGSSVAWGINNAGFSYARKGAIIGGEASAAELRFLEPSGSGSNYTGFKAPVLAGNIIYTLPDTTGAPGDALIINASNVLSWNATSGFGQSPGLPDTSIQFNNAGVFDGDATFFFDDANKVVNAGAFEITQFDINISGFTLNVNAGTLVEPFVIKDSGGNIRGGWSFAGAFFYRGFTSAPTNSLANDGKLFYDITGGVTNQQLLLSKNTGTYNPVIVANQASYVTKRLGVWSSTNWELEDSPGFEYQAGASPNVRILAQNNAHSALLLSSNSGTVSAPILDVRVNLVADTGLEVDGDSTAGNTRLLIYDVDNATLERVSVGAADSGGTGFKLLRIPN